MTKLGSLNWFGNNGDREEMGPENYETHTLSLRETAVDHFASDLLVEGRNTCAGTTLFDNRGGDSAELYLLCQ